MKKTIYIILLLVPFIFTGVRSDAMPPHPDLLKKWQEEGTINKNLYRITSSKTINRSSETLLKSAPSSGTVRIPVILVAYANAYAADVPLILIRDKPFDRENLLIMLSLSVIILFVISIQFAYSRPALRSALPVYLVMLSIILSCKENAVTGSPERDFPTDSTVYDNLLNSATMLSVRQYYSDMSAGNLNLQFDVYGPVTLPKTWEYYGSNDLSGNDQHPGELAGQAIRLMISKYSDVDFSIYDSNDADLEIDSVIIIHEGPGEEYATSPDATIWSHQWDLASAEYFGDGTGPVSTDGVSFNSYVEVPEYTAARGDSSVGVFAHEFGHVLGLPDLYDTSNVTDGVGDWSLMGSGSWGSGADGVDPAPLLAWERLKVGGTGASKWVTVTELSGSVVDQSINNIEVSRTAYMVMLDSAVAGEEQYILIEGKYGADTTGWYVPGTGLLITHIHNGIITDYSSTNSVNSGDTRVHGVNIVEADNGNNLWNDLDGNTGSVTDLYKTGNNVLFNDTTSPNTKYYESSNVSSKTGTSGVSISGITATSFPTTFDLN